MRRALLVLVLVTPLLACKASGTFQCARDDQCVGSTGGRCETDGWCSFADSACMSGQRYDDYAGGNLAGTCVGAMADAAVDAPDTCMTWKPEHFDPCVVGAPGDPVMLDASGSPYVYDTTNMGGDLRDSGGTLLVHSNLVIMSGGQPVALLNVQRFGVESSAILNVIGPKPLVIASWTQIVIGGTVDVGSITTETDATAHIQQSTRIGAGANRECGSSTGMPGFNGAQSGGSGGGGGGAFAGAGGAGAVGDANCTEGGVATTPCPRPGGPGGTAFTMIPNAIRGGCAGANSGTTGNGAQAPATPTTVSRGGAGGGGIIFAALDSISIGGTVRASGAAGAGSPQGSAAGGGGGGSGGLIGLDARMVTVAGTLAANGGGGGASSPFAGFGNVGINGTANMMAAPGGAMQPVTCGLAGGAGAANTALSGTTATGNDSCGGGGGGGGAGFILRWATNFSLTGTASPAVQVGP